MITIKPLQTLYEAIILRVIRNEAREFLIDKRYISFIKQITWFLGYFFKRNSKYYCYVILKDREIIGYTSVDITLSDPWITVVIEKVQRLKGFGREAIKQVSLLYKPKQIFAGVSKKNGLARYAFDRNGFYEMNTRAVWENDEYITYVKKW